LIGLYFATQAYLQMADMFRADVRWQKALGVNLTYYYLWGLFTPVVFFLARRFRLETKRWAGNLLIHLAASAALTSVQIVLAEIFLTAVIPIRSMPLRQNIPEAFRGNFHSSLPTYWLILFVYYSIDYYAKYRDREVRASQLEARLSAAQLQALKMQLNPHFLFNTLNSISSLMYTDVEAADAMMTQLSEFLRLTLESDGSMEVPLRQELDFLNRYLQIERIRFEDRLTVRMNIDADTLDAQVPNLALQPLVENALRHGIAPRPEGGTIVISSRKRDGMLEIDLVDDGPGLHGARREGIGLTNTRARLEQLYGPSHEFELRNGLNGGLTVNLKIPFHVEKTEGL